MSTAPVTPAPSLNGVKGWLLTFIVILFINSLCYMILALPVTIGSMLFLPLAALGIYAGVELARKQKNGVLLAKIFLAGTVIAAFLGFVGANTDETVSAAGDLIRGGAFFFVWFMYLKRSKRVAQTYGA